jgi:hypothetical protein
MDCGRNAVKKLLKKFRCDHPHLKVISTRIHSIPMRHILETWSSTTAIYILGVKEGDHKFLL